MRRALPSGSMVTLLSAWLLIGTSGWAFVVAIAVYAFLEDGAGAVAAMTVARLVPALIAAPFVGHLIDRIQRDRVAALFSVFTAASMAAAGALVLADASLVAIGALVALSGLTQAAPRPALQTLMPALARTPEELTRGTAAWSAIDSVGFLLGSGLGGILIAAFDPGPVIAAAAVCMALAGLLSITLPATAATLLDEDPEEEEGVWASAAGGVRAVREIPALRVPVALLGGLLILEGSTDVQLVALALGELDMGDGGPGLLYAVWGVGGVIGSASMLALLRRRGYGLAMGVGALVLGLGLVFTGTDGVILALAMMIPAGLGFALVEAAAMGLVPRLADDAVAGRVYGLYELLYAGAGALGALITPGLIALVGVRSSFIVVGGSYALLALFAWRALARLDGGQEEASRIRELLRGVPILRPLPLPRLERLVQNSRPSEHAQGATIVSRGEPGEDFFVIEEGAVEIVEYGRSQHAGEAFGEIALLREVPRTATVRATTDVRLRAIGRPAFIGAIAQDGDASSIADTIIDEHLARQPVET